MTYLELQDEVLTDRFGPAKRPSVKNWINHRYGRLWDMEDWVFKYQITTLNVPYLSSSIARGTIGDIIAFADATVIPYPTDMAPTRPEDFLLGTSTVSGRPGGWTIVGDTILFDRPMERARSFTVLSQLKFVPLVSDGESPLIPSEFHLTIAAGAASHGLRLENDPSWEGFEQDWSQGVEDMKREYLTSVRTYGDVYPNWP